MLKNRERVSGGDQELAVISSPQSPAAEEFRRLCANIRFSASSQEVKSLAITSAAISEGRSWVAANLAVICAQDGERVLLVDSDMRKPTIHEKLNAQNDIGLSSVLTGQTNLESAIRKTSVINLDLLSCGPIPSNAAELLASHSMASLMDTVKKSYSLVVYDSPPILSVVDGQIIVSKCDSSLLVINSGKTDREEAAKAKEAIILSGGRLLGAVLNNFSSPMSTGYRNR